MGYTEAVQERHVPLAVLYPVNRGAGVYDTGYVSLAGYHRAWALVEIGAMAAGATFDVDMEIATDDAGTDAYDLKETAQLTQAADGNDHLVLINLRSEEITNPDGLGLDRDYVNLEVTIGVNAVYCSVVIFGTVPRYAPGSEALWDEIVD